MNGTISLTNKLRGSVSMANTIINGGASPYPKSVGPAAIASFSDGADSAPLKSLIFGIEPQQSGSGDPSPTNIRPISGWTQVDGVAAGANLMKQVGNGRTNNGVTYVFNADGTFTLTGTATSSSYLSANLSYTDATKQYFTYLPAGTYAVSGGVSSNIRLYFVGIKASTLSGATSFGVDQGNGATFTLSEPYYIYTQIYVANGTATNLTVKPMLTTGSTPQPYAAPAITPITIQLGQTVYGGTVDALQGEAESQLAAVDMGSLTWTYYTSGTNPIFRAYPSGIVNGVSGAVPRMISSSYKVVASSSISGLAGSLNNGEMSLVNNAAAIVVRNTAYTDAASFKAAMAGQTIVYELATPIEVDLTPVSVNSLLGQNNIWANSGDTEVEYYPAAASVVAVLDRQKKAYISIPLSKIAYESYSITPNQMLDLDSYRSESGVLLRTVLSHTATKIEFNTPHITSDSWQEVWDIIQKGFISAAERSVKIKYYDPDSNTYKTAKCYVPDIQYTIRNVEEATGIINYDPIRVAFIEY